MFEVLLVMEGICKRFPGVTALQDVHLEVRKGEVHALLGENGAGKSTLMKILTGVYRKDGGTIRYKGEEVEFLSPREAQEAGISIIYQEFNLMPHLTVAQNILIGREPRTGIPWFIDEGALNRQAKEILDSLHIDIDVTAKVASLSVAEQQMVEIAKAISFQSDLLIMDEPTAALTEGEIKELFRVIHGLKRRGVSIIYISHRLEELKHLADRVTVLRDGRYITTVPFSQTSLEELIRYMVGRDIDNLFPKISIPQGDLLLEVRNLCRRGVLHDISFCLRRGEILGVAGLMGAGRTELARAVFGADPIDEGEIFLEGRKVVIRNPHEAIKEGIAYLTEDRKREGLALNLTVSDNLILASIRDFANPLWMMKTGKVESTVREFINELKIKTPSTRQKVKFLSGGNQQKVIIARWLCKKAKVFIFDEPTRGIDVGAKHEVYQLMNELVSRGAGIIMISSELPEILGLSDRILVMHEGRIAGELSREDATQEKILYLATGGK